MDPLRHVFGSSRRITDQLIVPADVWPEGLVNAVVHRSFSMADDCIRVSIAVRLTLLASSRLSLEQQDALPHGAEEVLAVLRNLSRLLGTGDIVEETGRSGPWVRRVLNEMESLGLVAWDGPSGKDPRARWSLRE